MRKLNVRLAGVSVAVLHSLALLVVCLATKNYVAAWGYLVAVVLAYQPALRDLADQLGPYGPTLLARVAEFLVGLPVLLKKLLPTQDQPPPPPPPPSPKPGGPRDVA